MHNTSTALLQMFDTWLDALDNDEISAVIMMDLSAAFDVVDHDILIDKLKLYGLDEATISWFSSYLSSRSQQVFVEGALSTSLSLEAGVPQGSVLGPLLYILLKMIYQKPLMIILLRAAPSTMSTAVPVEECVVLLMIQPSQSAERTMKNLMKLLTTSTRTLQDT